MTEEKAKGGMDETKGKVQEAWGDLTGDDNAKAEGQANQAKGNARQGLGDVENAVNDAVDNISNA